MREIAVTIEGLSPLLMHNIAAMTILKTNHKIIPSPEAEAAAGCYWLDEAKSSLAVPSEAIHRCLIKAAGSFKEGRKSASGSVTSLIHVGPDLISLNTKDYIIDVRGAVVQKNRISRARPKIDPWTLNFSLFFDEVWLQPQWMRTSMVDIIKNAGRMVGILDYRPEKKGPFGTFRLTRFELLPEREQAPEPEPEIAGFDKDKNKPAA